MGAMEEVKTLNGNAEFPCYVAKPDGEATAAIIVIQEIFGVNKGIKAKCDHWASLGYLAIAPDLFWRINEATDLDADVEEEFQTALDLMGRFNQDQGIRDIEAAIHFAQNAIGSHKVGCVGYCLGGRLAFMTACRTDIRASVGYYGVGIDGLLGEKHAIAHEVMLHIPTADGLSRPMRKPRCTPGWTIIRRSPCTIMKGWTTALPPSSAPAATKRRRALPTAAPKPFSRSIWRERPRQSEGLA